MRKISFILDGNLVTADLEARLFKFISRDGRLRAMLYIPGMEVHVMLPIDNGPKPRWKYNDNEYRPTFSPSILTEYRWEDIRKIKRNHVIIRAGMIQYLSDCTHEYAGKTIYLPRLQEWPDWAKYW